MKDGIVKGKASILLTCFNVKNIFSNVAIPLYHRLGRILNWF